MFAKFLLVAVGYVAVAHGAGCGEPAATYGDCGDWQCSRTVSVRDVTSNGTTYYCVRGLPAGSACTSSADCYRDLVCPALTLVCTKSPSTSSYAAGYVSVLIAAIFFGSNYLPVRKMRCGNGVLYQFFMTLGIVTVGVAVQLYRQNPYLYPSAMLGGMLWAIGNCMAVRVINAIGVGLAVTTWGCSGMVFGWLSGRFGFWGMTPEKPSSEAFSISSVVVAVVAIVLFGFVKPGDGDTPDEDAPRTDGDNKEESMGLLNRAADIGHQQPAPLPTSRRLSGFFLAIVCGVFNGFTFDPAQSMMDQYAEKSLIDTTVKYSPDGLDYAFSTFLGIFLTGLAYALIGTAASWRFSWVEVPDVTPAVQMLVPAFLSGAMWAAAATAWFVANTNLGLAVSYPLVALGPCIVASLWGVLYLHEIRGRRNFMFLAAAFAVAALSCAFTVLSK